MTPQEFDTRLTEVVAANKIDRPQMIQKMLTDGARKLGYDKASLKEIVGHAEAAAHTGQMGYWANELVTTAKGSLIWCAENAGLYLENHEDWQGVFGYNRFAREKVLLKPLPNSQARRDSWRARPIEDSDYTQVVRWFNANGFPSADVRTVTNAVIAACEAHPFHPVRDYLKALEWDGQERLGSWLTDLLGAPADALTSEFGRRFLISAVARILKPGCKADHMLVFEGPQGAQKSTAIAALFGPDWFGDSLPNTHSKDAMSYIQGLWVVEMSELAAMSKSESSDTKAFLSRTSDRWRPAYGREEIVRPRQCVFIGTTNDTDYLRDQTGGRRFWPVSLGKIDLDRIKSVRDQLWAEARVQFQRGERWWLDAGMEALAREIQADRSAADPWLDAVANFLNGDGKIEVSSVEVFRGIGVSIDRAGGHNAQRIAGIMRKCGFVQERPKSGPNKDRRMWVRTGSVPEQVQTEGASNVIKIPKW